MIAPADVSGQHGGAALEGVMDKPKTAEAPPAPLEDGALDQVTGGSFLDFLKTAVPINAGIGVITTTGTGQSDGGSGQG